MNARPNVPVRWRLFQTAGKIVHNGRQALLKISAVDLFAAIRACCARGMQDEAQSQKYRDRGRRIDAFSAAGGGPPLGLSTNTENAGASAHLTALASSKTPARIF
jgi:hypothetical protein